MRLEFTQHRTAGISIFIDPTLIEALIADPNELEHTTIVCYSGNKYEVSECASDIDSIIDAATKVD